MLAEMSITEACKRGDLVQLRRWGRQGVRVSTWPPLLAAVTNGHLDVMRYLVNKLGADVDRVDDEGQTALHAACSYGQLDTAKCVLGELSADVDKEHITGATASFFAAYGGNLDIMRCLVREYGVDINHSNNNGETALIVAAWFKHATLTKWMVKAGADPQAKNAANKTAADVSRNTDASPEQTVYLGAKAHCAQPGCSGAGTKKCQGCMHGQYCGEACFVAHWPAHRAECRRLGDALKRDQEKGGE
jgi:hypothetical protein